MNLSEISTLKAELPHGSLSRIAESVGASTIYVSKVLGGEFTGTDLQIAIVRAAKEIVAEKYRKLNGEKEVA